MKCFCQCWEGFPLTTWHFGRNRRKPEGWSRDNSPCSAWQWLWGFFAFQAACWWKTSWTLIFLQESKRVLYASIFQSLCYTPNLWSFNASHSVFFLRGWPRNCKTSKFKPFKQICSKHPNFKPCRSRILPVRTLQACARLSPYVLDVVPWRWCTMARIKKVKSRVNV